MNSVIFFTGNPRLRATSEWASSCKSTETKRRMAEMKPTTQYVAVDHPGYNWGNQPVARETVSKTRMMIQLTLISISIPAILPIRNEPGIEILLPTDGGDIGYDSIANRRIGLTGTR